MMQPQSTLFRGPNEHVGPLKKDQCALTPKICPLRKALRRGEVAQVGRPRAKSGTNIMTSGDQDQDFFRQRGFGLRIGFGERPALLVIDMVKAFTDPAMMLGADLDAQVAAISPLLGVAHERGITVIFSTVMYHTANFIGARLWELDGTGV